MGGHRVPADLDCSHPAVGQDLRPPRSTADVPSRDCRLLDRLVDLRLCSRDRRLLQRPGDQRHDRRPSRSRPWRRRPDGACSGRHRRRDPASRAGQVSGILRLRVRCRLRRRSATWRLVHRQSGLGVDLLHQHPDRDCCPGSDLVGIEAASRTPPSHGRLPRRGHHRGFGHQPGAVSQLGRSGQGLDLSRRHLDFW